MSHLLKKEQKKENKNGRKKEEKQWEGMEREWMYVCLTTPQLENYIGYWVWDNGCQKERAEKRRKEKL